MNAVAQIHTETLTLEQACAALDAAKVEEAAATMARVQAENLVLAFLGDLPAEGTTREPAGKFVAVVQTSIRRKVDADKLAEIAASGAIPDAIGKRLLRWKPELDTRELRYIQANEPQIYAAVAEAIEAKPAKPAIKIELAKEAA